MKRLLASLLVISASGCPDVTADKDEGAAGPYVEYDPARSQTEGARYIPFPNDLARDAKTGKIALGMQACESLAAQVLRSGLLNTLDGFGDYESAIQVTFSEDFDMASTSGNVALFEVKNGSIQSTPVPIVMQKTTMLRQHIEDCATPELVPSLVVIPQVPLGQHEQYILAIKKGLTNASGTQFGPSLTFALASSKIQPVTLDEDGNVIADRTPLDPSNEADLKQLKDLYGLWKTLEPALALLDKTPFMQDIGRDQLLVMTEFTTQTTSDPLDPTVAESAAAYLPSTPFLVPPSQLSFGPSSTDTAVRSFCTHGEGPGECAMELALGGCAPGTTGCSSTNYDTGRGLCTNVYACAAVGNILVTAIGSINFQTQVTNPVAGLPALQGAWDDNYHPTPQGSLTLGTIIATPLGTPPATGWPVVIYGHGFGSSKESIFAIAGRLSLMGFVTVAIDYSQHGSRAVQTSKDPALGCIGKCYSFSGTEQTATCNAITDCNYLAGETCGSQTVTGAKNPPGATSAPQCYQSIFSTNLANTRDNFRQTILDLERVAKAVKGCGTTSCVGTTGFKVDPARIYYGGLSLGSLIGASAAALSPEIKGAALNVPAVGWLDVIENTETKEISCPLVNGLIDAKILTGEKWTPTSTTDICTTGEWKTQPGFITFAAIGRWVLDPSEPANFVSRLKNKKVLLQSAVGDMVLNNITQQREAAILGLAPMASSPFNPGAASTESTAISTDPTASKYVTYTSDANHVYTHSTLLRPSASTVPATFGTLRMQVDFMQFLDNINGNNH